MITFSKQVQEFEHWFSNHEKDLRTALDQNKTEKAQTILKDPLSLVLGEFPFQLYRTQHNRYIVEFNTILDNCSKILCYYLCDNLKGKYNKYWDFYYYHPAFKGTLTGNNNITFTKEDIDMHIVVDKQRKKFDIHVINNAKLTNLPDSDKYMVVYMMLIDYAGELVVESYIGSMQVDNKVPKAMIKKVKKVNIMELAPFISEQCVENKWTLPKDISLVADTFKAKNKDKEVRKDIIEGVSYCLDLLNEEGGTDKAMRNFLRICKVGYYSILLKDRSKTVKNVIEVKVNEILNKSHSGMIVSSCIGNSYNYIDFFVYDDATLVEIKSKIIDTSNDTLSLMEL
jgi:hypothetical protein